MNTEERWTAIRADHVCGCPKCDPTREVMTQRAGPHHIAVRFWEEDGARRHGTILLDGEPVTGVYEAILGDEGTVWAVNSKPDGGHSCLTCVDQDGGLLSIGTGLCRLKLSGRVEFRVEQREGATP